MSDDQKGTGIGSFFQELVRKIAGLFSRNRETKASREGNTPVFPPAGSYANDKRKLDTDRTVVFSESEIKKTQNSHKFADTMYVPGLAGAGQTGKRVGGSLFVPRTKKPNFVLGVILTSFKLALAAVFVLVAVGSGVVLGLANAYLETTPELDVGKIQNQALSSFIYNEDGSRLLTKYTGSENREWITLDQIPLDLQHAVVAKEDIRFYSHNGVDVKRLVGALVSNVTSSSVTGGSTITQQLIKNSILTNERSYKRKLQEAYLAMELEKKYSKDQILEAYLNTIPLGGLIYGVKTASKEYFGKDLTQLSLKQEVCLAAVIESPYKYDPHRVTYTSTTPNKDVGDLQNKMNEVTERMYAAGFITKQQYDDTFVPKSIWDSPNFLEQWKSTMGILETSPSSALYPYPHFIEYVIYNVETMFLRKENLEDTKANRAAVDSQIRQNGYKIYCTIDEDIQNTVQTTISQWNNYPAFKSKSDNFKTLDDGTKVQEPQASSVVIDNQTGYIVALIGSRDTPTAAKTLNRAYQAHMPVGSSIKPLAVYGPAFDLGLSPATPIANVPVPITGWVSDVGYPTTSSKPYGAVSIRQGIVSSLNICAARTLMDYVGIAKSASYLEKLNVNMDYVKQTGSGLALGVSGLTTLEMAGGYACLANNGYYREPMAFTKVEDKNGNVVMKADDFRKQYQVYKPSTAYMLVDVLKNAVDSGTGHNAQIPNVTVAGKTGTVVDNKGVFFAGMTGYYTSTLWVGHDEYKEFASGTAASNSSAPLWQKYMSKIYQQKGLGDRRIIDKTEEEEGIIRASCDAIMGGAPIDGVPANSDMFAAGTVPNQVSYVFKQEAVDTSTNMLAGPNCPPQYVQTRWVADLPDDNPYKIWMKQAPGTNLLNFGSAAFINPIQCTLHTAGYSGNISYAQSIVGYVGAKLQQFGGQMSQAQKDSVNAALAALQAAIGNPLSSDEQLSTAANAAQAAVDNAIAGIKTATPPPPSATVPASTPTPITQ